MSKKFQGSYADLRACLVRTGVGGEWQDLANQKQFRADNGAILNWWESTGSISFQGPPLPAQHLEVAFSREQKRGQGVEKKSGLRADMLEDLLLTVDDREDERGYDGKESCADLLEDLRADALSLNNTVRELTDTLKRFAAMLPKR